MLSLLKRVPRSWQIGLCCLLCGVGLLFLGVALGGGTREHIVPAGTLVAGFGTLILGTITAIGALGQLKVARLRHEEQTKADLLRRITESFAKAVEQLGSDKLEVRLGGIYTLERISKESTEYYWPIMETLTALVRERVRWKEDDDLAFSEKVARCSKNGALHLGPPADIAAILAVIGRRSDESRAREVAADLYLNFQGVDLKHSDLRLAHLERAFLAGACLDRARLENAHLEGAWLGGARLERANLQNAHLEGAKLLGASLEGASSAGAHFEGAELYGANLKNAMLHQAHFEGAALVEANLREAHLFHAYLERAVLARAHLEGADLRAAYLKETNFHLAYLQGADLSHAVGMVQGQIDTSFGDETTILPEGLKRPTHWARIPE